LWGFAVSVIIRESFFILFKNNKQEKQMEKAEVNPSFFIICLPK
jgi:hypothetical protein